MNQTATMKYIDSITKYGSVYLSYILVNTFKHEDFQEVERILDNKDVYRYFWNNLALPYDMTYERIVDYDEFNNYPKFREFLKKRLEAYWKIDDDEYVHKEFSSERLKYIPFYYIKDYQLEEKFSYDDWKSFYIEDVVIPSDVYVSLRNKMNHFCIIEKDTESRVGILTIHADLPTKKDWNIGYMVAKEYRGKGYAREAVNAMIEAIKNQHIFGLTGTYFKDVYKKYTNCKNIVGVVHCDNIPSQKVLERCGFEKTSKFNKEGFITYIYKI